ncbi:MAG: hypothetical protein WC569_04330 [Candidatus Omnitrophota bacterium]
MSQSLDKRVRINNISFLPYGELVFHDISVDNKDGHIQYAYVKRCHVGIGIIESILTRSVVISRVSLSEPIFLPDAKDLFGVKGPLVNLERSVARPGKNFLLKLKSSRIVFPDASYVNLDAWFLLKNNNRVYSRGLIDLKKSKLNYRIFDSVAPADLIDILRYRLEGSFMDDMLFIDRLLLDPGSLKLEAGGSVKNYKTARPEVNLSLRLKEPDLQEKAYLASKFFIKSVRNFILRVKGNIREPSWSINLDEFRTSLPYLPGVLRVDNFYCNLRLSKNEFVIDDLGCFLNDFPIGVKCKVVDFKDPRVEFNMISYPGQIVSLRPFNPMNFEISFSGYKEGRSVKGRTSFQTQKLLSVNPRKTYNAKISVVDLQGDFSERVIENKKNVLVSLKAKDIIYETDAPGLEMNIGLSDFSALVYPDGTRLYAVDLGMSGCKGSLKGNGYLDFYKAPPKLMLDFKFYGFDVAELVKTLRLNYESGGVLSGKGVFNSRSDLCFSGDIDISDGYIKSAKLMGMISDFLSIPSLKEVYFDSLFSRIFVSRKDNEVLFDSVRILSKDIDLKANVKLKDLEKVNGEMSVRLSNALLKESFRLRMLFFMIGEQLPYEDFEFEIGGMVGFPHLKWLDTAFKESIMRYLSASGKLAMERSLEEAIDQLIKGN